MFSKKSVMIFCLILIVLYPIITASGWENNAFARENIKTSHSFSINTAWFDGESISVLFMQEGYLYPSELDVAKGTILSGSIFSLYSVGENLLVKAEKNSWTIYLEIKNFNGGYLEILARICINDTSANVFYYTQAYLNISIYNSFRKDFVKLGIANSTLYHIDQNVATIDQRLIIKLEGEMTTDLPDYMYYYANISYAWVKPDPQKRIFQSMYKYIDSHNILHKLPITVDKPNTKVVLQNISIWWRFLYAEPEISLNYTERSFIARDRGTYVLYFTSSDKWRYPDYITSQIVLLNSRGQYLPIDAFKVLYRFIKESYIENHSNPSFLRDIIVNNPYPFSLPNCRMRIILSTNNFSFFATKNDLTDIFFVLNQNNIPHYIESWDGRVATIFIKANLTIGINNITMYYGAPQIVAHQDPSALSPYVFFDTFNYETTLLNKNWTIISGNWRTIYDSSSGTSLLSNEQDTNFATISTKQYFPPYVVIKFSTLELIPSSSTQEYLGPHKVLLILLKPNSTSYFALEFTQIDTDSPLYQIKLIRVLNGKVIDESETITNEKNGVLFDTFTISAYINQPQEEILVEIEELEKTLTLQLPKSVTDLGYVEIRVANGSITLDQISIQYPSSLSLNISLSKEKINPIEEDCRIVSNYQRALTPYILVPRDCLINIIVLDAFNTTLINKTLIPKDSIPLTLRVYSFKIKNNRDDTFVHVKISKHGTPLVWSEWLAPGEIAEYLLSPSMYSLEIVYPNGEAAIFNSLNITEDVYFMINGTVLGDVIAHLEKMNESFVQQFYQIDIYLSNLNSTIKNQTINLQIHIENINATISQLLYSIRMNLTAIESNITELLYNIANEINSLNSMVSFLNTSIIGNLTQVNSTITGLLIDFKRNITLILTNVTEIQLNTTQEVLLVNSSISKLLTLLKDDLIGLNTTINSIYLNISNNLLMINSSIGELYVNLTSQLLIINASISQLIINVLNNIRAINATISRTIFEILQDLFLINSSLISIMWNLTNEMITIKSEMGNVTLNLHDYIMMINATLNNLTANIRENTLLINSVIYLLNETVLVTLADLQMNVTKVLWLTLDELRNLTELIPMLLNVFKIRIFNYYTMESIPLEWFRIIVNSTQINDDTIWTLGERLNITVLDYWGRVLWSNITTDRDIRILLKMGEILIINEREETIQALIAPENTSRYLCILLPPYTSYRLLVYSESRYNITILSGQAVISSGIYRFPHNENGPRILLRVSYKGVFLNQSPDTTRVMIISLVVGILSSAVSSTIFRIISLRRALVKSDHLLKKILEEIEKEG